MVLWLHMMTPRLEEAPAAALEMSLPQIGYGVQIVRSAPNSFGVGANVAPALVANALLITGFSYQP